MNVLAWFLLGFVLMALAVLGWIFYVVREGGSVESEQRAETEARRGKEPQR